MSGNIQVLIVDDDRQVREITSRRLAGAGYIPASAVDGAAALTLLSQQTFGLVLLDIMMHGMSGIEVLRKIRNSYPDLAVIMMTSEDDPKVARNALDLGARGYLVKPFNENELLIYVSHILRLHQLEKENREYRENLEKQVAIRTAELEKALANLKSYQGQLLHQEKLATIGHLTAGVAHEIKNPTAYIGSNLGSMSKYLGKLSEYMALLDKAAEELPAEKNVELRQARDRLKLDSVMEDMRNIIVECLEGVERIKKIVEGLKSFSRKEQDVTRPANINECLENTLTVAWNELKYKASIEKIYGDLPQIECFPDQLGQVFMNLLVNAAHAIENQGKIVIATRQDGDSVLVSISDTGCGIPKSIREEIFEPFFTTKKDGVGTGLGLSIIKEIVARHDGEITLESEEGKGSVFTVRLPIRQQPLPSD